MENTDITKSYLFPNKMQVDLYVLGALMLNRVGRHVDGADVVTVDKDRPTKWHMKLMEELAQPGDLSNSISHGPIFSLSAGPGDSVLALG